MHVLYIGHDRDFGGDSNIYWCWVGEVQYGMLINGNGVHLVDGNGEIIDQNTIGEIRAAVIRETANNLKSIHQ